MKKQIEQFDSIILTVGAKELKEKGYRNWLTNFMDAMNDEDMTTYWYKMGNEPTQQNLMWVYICIGGRIRFRANFVQTMGPKEMVFSDGRKMFGKAWIIICGPVKRAPYKIERKGFQGFRYTNKLF